LFIFQKSDRPIMGQEKQGENRVLKRTLWKQNVTKGFWLSPIFAFCQEKVYAVFFSFLFVENFLANPSSKNWRCHITGKKFF